jgi:Secretion system C-terminal sorting domain
MIKKLLKNLSVFKMLTFAFVILSYNSVNAQLNVTFSGNDVGNPAGITIPDNALNSAPSVNILPATLTPSLNIWSAPVALPFAFNIDGTPVTHYCANRNGLVTFDTTVKGTTVAAALNVNTALPNAAIPSPAIAGFWGDFTTLPPIGGNDQVWVRTIGTAPNRVHVINYFSFEIETSGFEYFSIVLEEGSNKIYVVDTYGSIPLSTYTVGVQKNATTAYSTVASPLQPKNGNLVAISDNEYYTFAPPLATDAGISAFVSPTASGCYSATQTITVDVKNYGLNPLSNIPVTVNITGVTTTTLTGTLAGPLASGATANLSLGTANLGVDGIYNLKAYTGLVGDLAAINDTVKLSVRKTTAPYLEDFNAATTIPVGWNAGSGVAVGATHGATATNGIFKNIYDLNNKFEFTTTAIGGLNSGSQLKYDFRFVNWSGFASGARVGTILRAGDTVRISISTNNGATYTQLKSYDTLNYTVADTSGLFRAGAPIPLGAYAGQCVLIKFDGVVKTTGPTDFYPDFDNIEVTAPAVCTTPPVAGTISTLTPSVLTGTNVLFASAGASATTYSWRAALSPTGPFTAFGAPSNDSALLTGPPGTYYIRLYATASNCPTDSSNVVSVTFTKIVGDDACDAITLSVGANGPYKHNLSTVQVGEVKPPFTGGIGGASNQSAWYSDGTGLTNTMWFKFVATTKKVKILTNLSGENGDDTQIALWKANNNVCGDLLDSAAVTLLAANDDSSSANYSSIISGSSFCLTIGTTYYLQVDAYGNAVGDSLNVIFQPITDSTASFTGLSANYCEGDPSVTLAATPAGGTFTVNGTAATIFTPTAASSNTIVYTFGGCAYTSSQSVTVNANPVTSISPSSPTICAGGATAVTLTGSPAGGTFSVQSGAASALTGNSFNPTSTGTWTIVYTFTNASGCPDTSNINFNVNCTVGLNDISKSVTAIKVVPNPTRGNFDLNISNAGDNATIKLLSFDGRLLSTEKVDLNQNNTVKMNIANYANGIYFVNIISGNVNKTIKITKQD